MERLDELIGRLQFLAVSPKNLDPALGRALVGEPRGARSEAQLLMAQALATDNQQTKGRQAPLHLIADEVQHVGAVDHTPVYPRDVLKPLPNPGRKLSTKGLKYNLFPTRQAQSGVLPSGIEPRAVHHEDHRD